MHAIPRLKQAAEKKSWMQVQNRRVTVLIAILHPRQLYSNVRPSIGDMTANISAGFSWPVANNHQSTCVLWCKY